MGSIGIIGPFSLWVSWILLLFTSLSLPIIKSLYIMKASFTLASGKKGDIRFGVWGACVYGVTPIEMGFSGVNYVGQCTKQGLGWTTRTVDTTQVADVAFGGLSWSLVLHPVACGAVIFSLVLLVTLWLVSVMGLPEWMYRKGETMNQDFVDFLGIFASLFPLGMTISAAILTTTVCIIDMIIVGSGITRAHKNPQAQTTVHFGGVPWITFVAMLLTWIGVVEAYRASFAFSKWKMTYQPIDY